uniref:Uncharacterized protein n=1 Tax=Rhizophora mucronata TaxID=61149 RepID=A0A2P2JKT0_RHIMU
MMEAIPRMLMQIRKSCSTLGLISNDFKRDVLQTIKLYLRNHLSWSTLFPNNNCHLQITPFFIRIQLQPISFHKGKIGFRIKTDTSKEASQQFIILFALTSRM